MLTWLADIHNPNGDSEDIPRWAVLVMFPVAVALVTLAMALGVPWLTSCFHVEPWGVILLLVAYLLVGYLVKPRFETGELEWWQWFIDIPFDFSDNIERFRVTVIWAVSLLFLPAHFITRATVAFVTLLLNARA